MPDYWQLLLMIFPIFALIGIGVGLRRVGWLTTEADTSLLKVTLNFLYPALILDNVLANAALRETGNLVFAPLVGFATMALGIWASYYAGKAIGLTSGHGLRTFGLAAGIYNYGYIPIPLMTSLFGKESVGVLMVHNVGSELAIWTVGILVLSGFSLRDGWRRLASPAAGALVVAVALNLLGVVPHIPKVALDLIHLCAVCAVPLALMLIGATLSEHFDRPRELLDGKIAFFSCVVRLFALPLAFLAAAKALPISADLKRVMIVQAAMPAGVFSIVIAKHYGGQPLTAVKVVVSTTVVGLIVIPLWLRFGLGWVF